ncbi:MAG TPA: DNA polymerase III subunit gamma/tau [Gemmatimonadota bacterium]
MPLALAYRPRRFSELVGQSHVTETLRNALRAGRVGSAYLFAGPRGSGKTTAARLLARAVNCTALEDGEPCGRCDLCVSIQAGRSLDVMEIDAASNRGIEDVRELRERVGYAAAEGRRKVYVVDEVHMLSKDAFNALLKTIEEPPPHVLFVFATTDPQKVLPTVLSRCQRFDFKRIPARDVEARLREICAREGQAVTEEALFLLSRKADGSLRDALSMLDQALALAGAGAGPLDADAVREVLGVAGLELYLEAVEPMRRRDPAAAVRFVRKLVGEGVDLFDFYAGLYGHLRDLMLFALPGGEALAETPDAFRDAYREAAREIGLEDLLRATAILTEHEFAFRGTSHPASLLEFLLVRLALLDRTADVASLLDEVRTGGDGPSDGGGVPVRTAAGGEPVARRGSPGGAGRGRPAGGVRERGPARSRAGSAADDPSRGAAAAADVESRTPVGAYSPTASPADDGPDAAAPRPAPAAAAAAGGADPAEGRDGRAAASGPMVPVWQAVVDRVGRQRASLGGMLAGLETPALEGDELVLRVPGDRRFVADTLREPRNQRLVEDAVASAWSGPRPLRLRVNAGEAATPERPPLRRLDRNDPLVRRALEIFDADPVV